MRFVFVFLVFALASFVASGARSLRKAKRNRLFRVPARAPVPNQSRRHAVVSLLYGSSSSNLLNLRTMMSSAQRHGLNADRLVMVPRGDQALRFRGLLESDGLQIVEVDTLVTPASMLGKGDEKHWGNVFTKFMAFNFTSYEKVLLIDSDAFFSGAASPDRIFQECGDREVCLVEDPAPELYTQEDCPDEPSACRQLNTGVMVFTPSAERLHHIMQELRQDRHVYHFPDQQFFSRYLRKTSGLSWKALDSRWNNCGHDPREDLEGPWVGHFCQSWKGKKEKNYRIQLCSETRESSFCTRTLRAWQSEVLSMDPCLSKQSPQTCEAGACGWCGSYCMDSRVDCTNLTLFDTVASPLG